MTPIRSLLLGIVAAAFMAPALAQQPAKCQLVKIAEWPVRLQGGHAILEGAINGQKVGVMLDTGAHRSLLMKSAAEKLDIPTRATNEIFSGFGGTSRAHIATLQEVRLGESVRKDWRVFVAGERPFPGVDFILGDDFFKLVDLEFDYEKSVVRVFQPENCQNSFLGYWNPNAQVVPIEMEDSKVVVPIEVNGRKGRAVFDSGASTSIIALEFAERLGLPKDSPSMRPASCSGGLGGRVNTNWVGSFDSFAVGGETIRNVQIRVQDYTTDMSAGARRVPADAFIGGDFLKTHRVFLSRSQNKLYFSYGGGQVFPAIASIECDQRTPAELDTAIAANPNDAKALLQRASLRLREKNLAGARADLDAVVKAEPANATALAMRSSVRAQDRDFDGALADSDAALAAGLRTAQLYSSRGSIRRAQGDCTRAIGEYDEALKIDPSLQSAQRGREVCSKK